MTAKIPEMEYDGSRKCLREKGAFSGNKKESIKKHLYYFALK